MRQIPIAFPNHPARFDGTREIEIAQERLESAGRSSNPNVRTPSRQSSQRQTRLILVKLPRVEVEHRDRGSGTPHRLPQTRTHECRREEPKVTTARHGQAQAENPIGQWWQFKEFVSLSRDPERSRRRVGDAIAVMVYGEDRRIIFVPALAQDIDRPGCLPRDAEGRRAKTQHGRARDLLKRVLALPGILSKALGREAVDARMVPAVGPYLVSGRVDGPDQSGIASRNVTHDEEGGFYFGPGKLIE